MQQVVWEWGRHFVVQNVFLIIIIIIAVLNVKLLRFSPTIAVVLGLPQQFSVYLYFLYWCTILILNK